MIDFTAIAGEGRDMNPAGRESTITRAHGDILTTLAVW